MEFNNITKGPWKAKIIDENLIQRAWVVSKDNVFICETTSVIDGWETAKANARVIATVHDMIETLKNIQVYLNNINPKNRTGDELFLIDEVSDILKKAGV